MRNCDKVARAALALLSVGWCQHESARRADDTPCTVDDALAASWDMEGATYLAAARLAGVTEDGKDAAVGQVMDALLDELVRRHAAGLDRYGGNNDRAKVCLSDWNDTPGRKPSDARDVMRAAIEALARKVAA